MKSLRTIGFLLLTGLVLVGICTVSNYVVPLGWFEGTARAVYRLVFLLLIPAVPFTAGIFRVSDRRWPLEFVVITCLLAPFLWYLLWVFLRRSVWKRASDDSRAIYSGRRLSAICVSAVLAVCGTLWAYCSVWEPIRITVRHYSVPIENLPAGMNGFRIVHVSDTHYGPVVSRSHVQGAIDLANSLEADLIVLTGDYVHRTPRSVEPGIGLLKGLRSRLGVVGVLGNHDHWEGANYCRSVFKMIGVPLIDNRRVFLTADGISDKPEAGKSICLGGIGDLWEDDTKYEEVLRGLPEDMPRILLAHNPDCAEYVPPKSRVDLMISGHTHGGQVKLPFFGAPIVPSAFGSKYLLGLCGGPHCPVVVSGGIGTAVLPVRFGVVPEVGVIELTDGSGR